MFVYCVAIAIQRPSGEIVQQALVFEEEHDARTLERRINEKGERMQVRDPRRSSLP